MIRCLVRWAAAVALLTGTAWAACPGPVLRFEPLAEGLWRVPSFTGDADALNRGQVSNLVLARDAGGRGLWALGSGPSPAFGRALACQARARLGLPVRWTISPWTRPEAVLGAGGLDAALPGGVVHLAHRDVAHAMAIQCPVCVARLRERLGAAAADLGAQPIRVPERRLDGASGELGPWRWWTLPRSAGRVLTLWRWQPAAAGAAPLWVAPGLLWGDAVPDSHDAEVRLLARAAAQARDLAAADGPHARWLGEHGGVRGATAAAEVAGYWEALLAAVRRAIDRGAAETDPPPPLDGVPAAWLVQPQHALNWQRAWRQLEPDLLDEPSR